MHSGKKLLATAIATAAAGAAVIGLSVSSASPGSPSATAAAAPTATPIKHVVVLFDENISFDHYFGTYPYAENKPGEPPFHAAPNTPSVNGLSDSLLTANPNVNEPQRLAPSQALTCDQNHGYTAEQSAFDLGLMDKFVQDTTGVSNCTQATNPDAGNYGPNGIVMDYYDGNTVTALWNYAQHFTLNDENFSTQFGPSTPGALNLVSGNTNPTTLHGAATASSVANNTTIGDPEPFYDQCSNPGKPLNGDGTPGGTTASLSGPNVGDLLNRKNLTWGWFQGGFTPSERTGGRAICGSVTDTTSPSYMLGKHDNIGNSPSADYSEHHEPFQYYQSTANPNHLEPGSLSQVGTSAPAGVNHQYDLTWFNQALDHGNLPSVSFLKAPEYEDGHAGYSDPLDEQRFLVDEINQIEQSPDWSSTAIVIAYDDSDGWYDHQEGPILHQSQDANDTLTGAGKCGSGAAVPAQNDRCGLGTRMPLLVISPWAKQNYVDSTTTDQSSITKFIEDNWNLGRIGSGSADSAAGSLMSAFDFSHSSGQAPAVIMDDNTGEVVKTIPPAGSGPGSSSTSTSSSSSTTTATTTTTSSTTTTSGGDGTAPGDGHGSGHGGSSHGGGVKITITLPNVTCTPKFSKRGLTLVCTTRGGSHVPTMIRIRLFRGRSLVANQASRVHGHTARFTVRRRLSSGSYKVRLTVDAAGRVGAQTRTLRVK